MQNHAIQALRINLCAFCSPSKLSKSAKAERAKIINNPKLATKNESCANLDLEKPKKSLIGKSYGSINALNVFKVGVAHDLYLSDGRPMDKVWPNGWDGMCLSDLATKLT